MSWRKSYAALTMGFGLLLLVLLIYLAFAAGKDARLRFASGQSGGVYQPMAESISELVAAEHPDIGIEVLASAGSAENAELLISGGADLALVQNDATGDESMRSLVAMHLGALHFLVRRDSGIESLGNLEGMRVGVGLESSGSYRLVEELLRHFEVDREKLELSPLGIDEGCQLLAEGKLDALLMVLSLRSDVVDRLVAGGDVRFVGIGRSSKAGSIIDGFRLGYPFVEPYLIPRYSYAVPHDGRAGVPDEAVPTVAVRTVLVASKKVPNQVARQITRTVVGNRSRLSVANRDVSMLDGPPDKAGLQFPLHEGAVQYYSRNEPGFLVRYAEVIGLLVSLLIAGYGVMRAGRKWLNQGQKDRIDAYYLELNTLMDRLLEPLNVEELGGIMSRLQQIRSTALHLLAKERLVPDESFQIFQTVLAEASAQVRHRLDEQRQVVQAPGAQE